MRYEEAIRILFGLESFGVKLGLDNIRLFIERLRHPERNFEAIHVAGTNGKGTVCSSVAAVLAAAGYKTGLFTSPHLIDYSERIRINGKRIPRIVVSRFMEQHYRFIRRNKITFFETTTAMAFDWFARERCDVAVVEVGLGGRLDATNILQPVLSVITAIDLDHTKTLGATRQRIAGEKAGIVKEGVPVICAPMSPSARTAIERIATRRKAPVVDSDRLVKLETMAAPLAVRVATRARFPRVVRWRYPGKVQRDNLKTVIASLIQLRRDGFRIPDRNIRQGLFAARWPGRFQVRLGTPTVIYDVAHNASAAQGLAEALTEVADGRHISAVFAVAQDKNWQEMIRYLSPIIKSWYFTRFSNKRSWLLTEAKEFARRKGLSFTGGRDPMAMVRQARAEAPPDSIVLVFGSHFLVGKVMPPSEIDPAPLAVNADR